MNYCEKSKGYAFISYATSDEAKKVLTELKDGVMVRIYVFQ